MLAYDFAKDRAVVNRTTQITCGDWVDRPRTFSESCGEHGAASGAAGGARAGLPRSDLTETASEYAISIR